MITQCLQEAFMGSAQIICLIHALSDCRVVWLSFITGVMTIWIRGRSNTSNSFLLSITAFLFLFTIPGYVWTSVAKLWQWRIEASRPLSLSPIFPLLQFLFYICSVHSLSPRFSLSSHSLHLSSLLQGCQATLASHQPNEQWYSANSMW